MLTQMLYGFTTCGMELPLVYRRYYSCRMAALREFTNRLKEDVWKHGYA